MQYFAIAMIIYFFFLDLLCDPLRATMNAIEAMRDLMKSLPQTDDDVVAALNDAANIAINATSNGNAATDEMSSGELLAFDFRAHNSLPNATTNVTEIFLSTRIKLAFHAIIEAVQVRFFGCHLQFLNFAPFFFCFFKTSPVFAESTQIKRVVRYLERLKTIQACLLHHARASGVHAHLPLSVRHTIHPTTTNQIFILLFVVDV